MPVRETLQRLARRWWGAEAADAHPPTADPPVTGAAMPSRCVEAHNDCAVSVPVGSHDGGAIQTVLVEGDEVVGVDARGRVLVKRPSGRIEPRFPQKLNLVDMAIDEQALRLVEWMREQGWAGAFTGDDILGFHEVWCCAAGVRAGNPSWLLEAVKSCDGISSERTRRLAADPDTRWILKTVKPATQRLMIYRVAPVEDDSGVIRTVNRPPATRHRSTGGEVRLARAA